MTTEELMARIRVSLVFWDGSCDAERVAGDAEDSDGKQPSTAYRAALARLIDAREVEIYTESGGEVITYRTKDGHETTEQRGPYVALRLIGDARRRVDFRNEVWVQDAIFVPYFYADPIASDLAVRSAVMKPPTVDSAWWQWQIPLWQRFGEIPVAQILAGTWRRPVVVSLRVTRPVTTESPDDAEEDESLWPHSRTGGLFSVPFDYVHIPEERRIVFVGQLPEEALGPAPVDSAYLWGSVGTVDEDDPSATWNEPRPGESWKDAERTLSVEASGEEEDSNAFGADAAEADPMVEVAVVLGIRKDQTLSDMIFLALERAGIGEGMWGYRGREGTICVRASIKELAIRVLKEDSQRHRYHMIFTSDAGIFKKLDGLRLDFRFLRGYVKDRTHPLVDREDKLQTVFSRMERLREHMSPVSFDSDLLLYAGPALVCWWRDMPRSVGRLDGYLKPRF
jgi:hypothetical protein